MSFKDYLTKKNKKTNIEIQIEEYKENFLADLSKLIFDKSEKASELLPETIDFHNLEELCNAVGYSKSTEFEISLKSKNIKKIIEHIDSISELTETKKNNLEFNIFKNKIYEYIAKIKNETLCSEDIDLIFKNHLREKEAVLKELVQEIKKIDFFENEKIIVKPIYNFEKKESDVIKISIRSDYDAFFYCEVKNKFYEFQDFTLINENEKFKSKAELFFNELKNKRSKEFFDILYFEWPKEKRAALEKNKKELSWGILVNLPKNLNFLEEIPPCSEEKDIWKIKFKNSINKTDNIVWIERLANE